MPLPIIKKRGTEKLTHFFAYLSRMKHIKRWGLMRNTKIENVKEHSLDVAMIAHVLALIKNTYFDGDVDAEHVLALSVYHEAAEVITGDLATPIKYFNPEIKEAFKNIEHIAERRLLAMLPEELAEHYDELVTQRDSEERRLVKAADKICAYIKCVEEVKSGNGEFLKAKAKLALDIAEMNEPEVRYFVEECLPSYELTLDELN